MKNNLKVSLALLISISALSCSISPNTISGKEVSVINTNETVYVAKISENKGANITIKINSPVSGKNEGFSTKANTDGTPAKTASDVDHYLVYLIKNTTTGSYPLTGDPLNSSNIAAGPFTISNSGVTNKTVRFANVQPLETGSSYYVAVRAQDNTNADLIKTNNGNGTAWTGTTAATPYNGKVAVSTGNGVTVSSTYVASSNSPDVSINLMDAVGAVLNSNLSSTSGGTDTVNAALGQYYISTVAGTGTSGYDSVEDNNPAVNAKLNTPSGVAVDNSGNVYIADIDNQRIRKITASTGIITTIAGTGTAGYDSVEDNNPAVNAKLNTPLGVAVDSAGNVYIADTYNDRIRKVTASTGIITTIAGKSVSGYDSGEDNNPAVNARLNNPVAVAVDNSGNVYIADTSNQRIRKITASTGIITTIAGTGTYGYDSGEDNNPAVNAKLNYPKGLAVDSVGNVYIADLSNNRIRKVTASTGLITTVAGTGTAGYDPSEDNNPAINAKLSYPQGVAVDNSGNVYIADTDNHRIRKINTSGIIITIAGKDAEGYDSGEDNNPAINAKLSYPYGVAVDSSGNAYIADYSNHIIRKLYKN